MSDLDKALAAALDAAPCVCGEPTLGVVHRADGPCYLPEQAPPAAAVPEVDWRELYRIQTAMRYMDNNPGLTRDHAFSWADQEVAAMLAAERKGE